MRVRSKKTRIALIIGVSAVAILFGYQNCSEFSEQLVPEASTLPSTFAYEFRSDTFGFMSCDNMSIPDDSAYFTVRAGAIKNQAGLSYSSEFHQSSSAQGRAMTTSILTTAPYSDVRLQFSVRLRANPGGTPRGPASIPSSQLPYRLWDAFPLSSDPVLYEMYGRAPTNPLVTFPGTGVTHTKLIGQIVFNQYPLATTQTELSTTSYAVFGFQKAGDPYATTGLLGPTDLGEAGSGVYGSGYMPGFYYPTLFHNGQPVVVNHGSRILSSLSQINMRTGGYYSGESNWMCPVYAQYRVVPYEQAAAAGCDTTPPVPAAGTKERQAYNSAKALLNINNTNHWIVDQANRCAIRNTNAVPHPSGKSLCYANSANVGWGLDTNGNITCGGTTGKVCPHYFSVCASYLLPD